MQPQKRLNRFITWIAVSTFFSSNVLAGSVDLATSPLVTGLGKVVSPNIFFILDDSLSMNSEYMPDSISTGFFYNFNNDTRECVRNFGFNTIYYNPYTTYDAPVNANGTSFTNSSFTGAWDNGYDTGAGTTDLSTTTPTYSTTTSSAGSPVITTTNGSKVVTIKHGALADGHVLVAGDEVTISGVSGSGSPSRVGNINVGTYNDTFTILSIISSTQFTINVGGSRNGNGGTGGGSPNLSYRYADGGSTPDHYYYSYNANATSPTSSCAADGSYTKKNPAVDTAMGRTVAQEKTNFANWYSFYRTRLLMMKTASGRAFSSLTDKYRVGFTTISEEGTGSSKFLDIDTFTDAGGSTQKTDWFTMLYGVTAVGYTPLRAALSKAGRLYGGKFANVLTGEHDPVQYSCQKNFTILTTDGFWNSNDESPSSDSAAVGTAATNYGPFKLDNVTRVGDQDGVTGVLKPYYDSTPASNTLADVAYYYYKTDLRPPGSIGGVTDEGSRIDVSTDNVPTSNSDPASHQHMTTFTLGLGVDGTLSNPGDYSALLGGTKNWPDPIASSTTQSLKRIDDLWHAAVNGHAIDDDGGNLSAKDPDAVVSELTSALQSITAVVGSSSAAATSNLQPISGDNTAFIAQFETVTWTGDLVARTIDPITGAIPSTDNWSAQTVLDATNAASRNIYTFSGTSGVYGYRRTFTAGSMSAGELNYFKSDSGNPQGALSQYSSLDSTQQAAATPTNMINYLRGTRTYENTGGFTAGTDVFRERQSVLGDIVSAAPVFVRKPPFAYTDAGYTAFLTSVSSRLPTVYVGSNDGMLHAFDGSPTGPAASGTGGTERWAYIPSMVMPNLYKLADSNYSINHRFYVDGPLAVGDAYSGSAWATILVGGLGGGGMGYYALDVTDPTSPKVLWEFGTAADHVGDLSYDADIGYSYGNPVLTKRASDNRWVVLFTSGYNNSGGDKRGHLYVVDAFTGEKLSKYTTTTSANEDLSGISRISNYVEDGLRNNVTQYVYAGDLSGALWKFDISVAPGLGNPFKMAQTAGSAGDQPITVQPELAKINGSTVVYFGTGRYLGPDDLSGSAPSSAISQAIYAVKDTNTYLGVLTSGGANLVSQTLNSGVTPRTTTNNPVDWSTQNGWYVTTPVGERFNVDPGLQLGTLVIAANIPETDYCQPTGSSVLYQLNYKSGFVLATNIFQAQIVGTTQVQLGGTGSGGSVVGGKIVIESVLADGTTMNTDQAGGGGAAGTVIRVNWREIE